MDEIDSELFVCLIIPHPKSFSIVEKDYKAYTIFNPFCFSECLFRFGGKAGDGTDNGVNMFDKIQNISYIYKRVGNRLQGFITNRTFFIQKCKNSLKNIWK
jgi:hypothetical protein